MINLYNGARVRTSKGNIYYVLHSSTVGSEYIFRTINDPTDKFCRFFSDDGESLDNRNDDVVEVLESPIPNYHPKNENQVLLLNVIENLQKEINTLKGMIYGNND